MLNSKHRQNPVTASSRYAVSKSYSNKTKWIACTETFFVIHKALKYNEDVYCTGDVRCIKPNWCRFVRKQRIHKFSYIPTASISDDTAINSFVVSLCVLCTRYFHVFHYNLCLSAVLVEFVYELRDSSPKRTNYMFVLNRLKHDSLWHPETLTNSRASITQATKI